MSTRALRRPSGWGGHKDRLLLIDGFLHGSSDRIQKIRLVVELSAVRQRLHTKLVTSRDSETDSIAR